MLAGGEMPPPSACRKQAHPCEAHRIPAGDFHRGCKNYIELLKYYRRYTPGGGDRSAGRARRSAPSPGGVLHDGNLLRRQPTKLADKIADLQHVIDPAAGRSFSDLSPRPAASERAYSRRGYRREWREILANNSYIG